MFDTHTHLDQEEFDADRDEVVARATAAGVETMIAVGTTAAASEKCVGLAEAYECVYAAVGLQPNYVAEAAPGDWDRVVALLDRPKVVALGETGLDRHWDFAPFDLQQDYFDRHLRLAQSRDLPVVIHMRDCGADIVAMVADASSRGPIRGVMHSFTGGDDLARQCIDLGLYISFAGMVTYKKSDALRSVAGLIPADRLLIETDSPYLSPHPLRKIRRNEPSHLVHTAACLADALGKPRDALAGETSANARRCFGL